MKLGAEENVSLLYTFAQLCLILAFRYFLEIHFGDTLFHLFLGCQKHMCHGHSIVYGCIVVHPRMGVLTLGV